MIYIKINDTLHPARIASYTGDHGWGMRASKHITLEMTHGEAVGLFVDGAAWSEVIPERILTKSDGTVVTLPERETDCADYCVAGPVTDNRDGTVTVKMGKKTDGEMLAELMEVLGND